MTFWAYMLQCADRHFYTGHTDDLETRLGQHQAGLVESYTSTRLPVHLVWSQEFPTRYEALVAERRIKGWNRAKKLALIRGDWEAISALALNSEKKGRASTGSARTVGETVLGQNFLHPHPGLLPTEAFSLGAKVSLINGSFKLHFCLTGSVASVRVPAPAPSARRDNLWRHSCFEAFVMLADGGYAEFNFSPSTEWAAYRFAVYREGMSELEIEPATIRVKKTERLLELSAKIAAPPNPIRLGLSAVIEEKNGTKSYWALRHPPGDRPDFHHPDCFALELPAPTPT